MIRNIALAALALVALPTAASAATFDFAGDFGNSVFSYGTGNGTSFTAFSSTYANCGGDQGFTCKTSGDASLGLSGLPAIGANTDGGSASFFTVTVPNNTLFLHPGSGSTENAVLQFTAPTTSTYSINAVLSRLDTTQNGNGVVASLYRNGSLLGGGTISPDDGAFLANGFNFGLTAGDTLSLVINNNGEVSYDSTGLSGTIASVPEPATWAMMIGGIGIAGGSLRSRRRKLALA